MSSIRHYSPVQVWSTPLASPLLCLASSQSSLWAGCQDGSLHEVTYTQQVQ